MKGVHDGICYGGVVLVWGDGFDCLGDGVELGAVAEEGIEDHLHEVAQAGEVVDDEDVVLVVLGGVEGVAKGGHVSLCEGEVDVACAGMTGDDVGSGCFVPAFVVAVGAGEFLLLLEGYFLRGCLRFGGDGG